MKLNLGFSVIANCVVLEPQDTKDKSSLEIPLHFDIESAMNFVARFGPDSIELEVGENHINTGKVVFSRKASDPNYIAILLLVDDETYIIKNPHQILRDVFEGYNKLVTLNKISSIIDFDFDAGLDFQQ